jgi:N-acetylneuraminic acid mutarotase
MHTPRRRTWRHSGRSILTRAAAVLGSLALAAGTVLIGSTPAQAQAAEDPTHKIQPDLQQVFDAQGATGFWIRFADRADLSQARQVGDWVARGEAVAVALRDTAQASQAGVAATLADRRVAFEPFWATNAIFVHNGAPALAEQIALHAEVEGLYAPVEYELIESPLTETDHQVNAIEWGIANINADDVWDQFGARGEGITVASIDTGTQFDHPALVGQYRGNLGDGEFDHNYNWFDAAGSCAGAPCDLDNHGTHTMGTMVGDDGAGNQIGVAPEASWITTNGCCPSDPALIASGQWLLEPTDLTGQNPDASKRPHIINNSWGSRFPSNDPFMEDVSQAWAASGILGIWSNGNSGELGCSSSGSPGSRVINYSVGAYDIDNDIASFSGRGPGQDGEIKPSISAPGVNVRSSLPGNGYGFGDGTSMAAPHVVGSVALLWSAAPALVGDTEATTALLDQTAVDSEDLQCGGTAADNNVYGEGRLDALALVQGAPTGDTGTLAGAVTDLDTGDPIEGATLTIAGPHDREVATGPDGSYSATLPAGDYTVTASAFGYQEATAEVSVAVGETTTQDFGLVPAPSVTVSGLVRDGSGHGWPMSARIDVDGFPEATTHSNPFTGRYRLSLPANATYTLLVEAEYPGYRQLAETVTVGGGNLVRDLSMRVDGSCTAPGYEPAPEGLVEAFGTGEPPAGWTVVDNLDNGQVWQFDDPGDRDNLTGGDGGFAIVDSDNYGSGGNQDTELVSPVVDMSGMDEPVIRFNQDFNWWSSGGDEFANVDLSIDGGQTWENVLHQSGADVPGPREDTIEIPQAAGEPAVQVRFHYGDATFEFWWQVDNVLVGTPACAPLDGGLVAGFVRDRNTGDGIGGATVTSVDNPVETAGSAGDGFYWMFSSVTGAHPFTASAGNYTELTRTAEVEADWITRRNFQLAAGQLAVEPGSVEAEVPLGGNRQRSFTITNTGTAPAEVELAERGGSFEILRADDTRLSEPEILASQGAPVRRLPLAAPLARLAGDAAAPALGTQPGIGTRESTAWQQPHAEPWTDLPNLPQTVMDGASAVVDGTVYSFGGIVGGAPSTAVFAYDIAGQSWSRLGDMPGSSRMQAASGAVDGLVYVVSGWSDLDTTTLIYDPASDSWSTGAPAPAGRAAAGSAVLDGQLYMVGGCTTGDCEPYADSVFRYDPASDSWQTLASYPVPTGWLSCGALAGELFCAGGLTAAGASTDTYSYDPASDSWQPRADLPFDLWGGAYAGANDRFLLAGGATANSSVVTNQGLAYDPASDAWEELPPANNTLLRSAGACGLYKVGGAEFDPVIGFVPDDAVELLPGFDQCGGGADVPWLSADPTTATLDPGESVTVTVSMRADVTQPGAYTAGLAIAEDTPYQVAPVDVTMNVTPPASWGKLTGTVAAIDCGGDQRPLADATVHLSTWVMELTLYTGADGSYAHWLDWRHSPVTMIVAKDGYQPQVRQTEVAAGEVTVEDWVLRRVCTGDSAFS